MDGHTMNLNNIYYLVVLVDSFNSKAQDFFPIVCMRRVTLLEILLLQLSPFVLQSNTKQMREEIGSENTVLYTYLSFYSEFSIYNIL